ncbi:MAG: hypothetical protein H6745_17260 [Deltaproteobacteria bacterium]|nr:hypothetical protein [Deltaproteobacteria bacterium]
MRRLAPSMALACALALGCGDGAANVEQTTTGHRADAVLIAPADTLTGEDADGGGLVDTDAPADTAPDGAEREDVADTAAPEDTAAATDTAAPCPLGHACNPVVIAAFPYADHRDTAAATSREVAAYGCAPATNEGGAEVFYVFTVTEVGVVSLAVDDVAGDAVDVDVHLLTAPDGDHCLRRDNRALSWVVRPGTYYVAVDTWVDGAGAEKAGPYTLSAGFVPLGSGPCAVALRDVRMFWSSCAAGVDCFEDGGQRYLHTPSIGPVVKEAHLVTPDEAFAGNGWPTAARDQIDRHYALSEAATGYHATRTEPWAPFGEGGSQWGQGAGGKPPLAAESWYVNMYWRDRPAAGYRLLVLNPANGRAVVAAGGYETGPGSNTAIGGVAEEVHDHLGTGHRDELVLGFLVDQSLPWGPIDCAP